MTDILPPPAKKRTIVPTRKLKVKSVDGTTVSEPDTGKWSMLNRVFHHLIIAERELKENDLIDFLIPSFRTFCVAFANWEANTFPVLEENINELSVYRKFVEIGEKLQLTSAKSIFQKNNPGLPTLTQLEGNFISSLCVNEDEMHKLLYDAAAFSEKLDLFIRQTRHYFDTDANNVIVHNQLVANIAFDKIKSSKKAQLLELMDFVLEVRMLHSNLQGPVQMIEQLAGAVAVLGGHRIQVLEMSNERPGPTNKTKNTLEKLIEVTKAWHNLNTYARVYTRQN